MFYTNQVIYAGKNKIDDNVKRKNNEPSTSVKFVNLDRKPVEIELESSYVPPSVPSLRHSFVPSCVVKYSRLPEMVRLRGEEL